MGTLVRDAHTDSGLEALVLVLLRLLEHFEVLIRVELHTTLTRQLRHPVLAVHLVTLLRHPELVSHLVAETLDID